MNILLISRGIPSDKYPMNGIFEFDQAIALKKLGSNVTFIAIDLRSIRHKRTYGIKKYMRNDIFVIEYNFPLGKVPNLLMVFALGICTRHAQKELIKKNMDFEVAHAHFPRIGQCLRFIDKTKIKVLTEHSSLLMSNQIPQPFSRIAKKAYTYADMIISVSPSLQNVLKDKFRVDSIYVPNIVDTQMFKPSILEKEKLFTFISVGNLIKRKRMDLTVTAFCEAFKDSSDCQLILIGGGEERENIESIISHHQCESSVHMVGRKNREEIAAFLRRSHVFVLPSQAETFGVVYIEAMSTGLPVIATRCQGPESFVHEKNGILIDVDNLEQLKEAMLKVKSEFNRYQSNLISEEVSSKFSQQVVAEQLHCVYNSLKRDNL